jgi:hypothetical protein
MDLDRPIRVKKPWVASVHRALDDGVIGGQEAADTIMSYIVFPPGTTLNEDDKVLIRRLSDEGTVTIEPDPEDATLMILTYRPHA